MATSVYGTVEELCARIEIVYADLTAAQIATLLEVMTAMSRKIDNFTRRPDGYVALGAAELRYFSGSGKNWMRIPECTTVTLVAMKAAYTDTTYVALATPSALYAGDGDWIQCTGSYEYPNFMRTPYTLLIVDPNGDYSAFFESPGNMNMQITATWGYATTVPDDIKEACLAQTTILWKRFQGSMSSRLATQDLGSIAFRIRQAAFTRDIKELLVDSGWVLPLYGGQR